MNQYIWLRISHDTFVLLITSYRCLSLIPTAMSVLLILSQRGEPIAHAYRDTGAINTVGGI